MHEMGGLGGGVMPASGQSTYATYDCFSEASMSATSLKLALQAWLTGVQRLQSLDHYCFSSDGALQSAANSSTHIYVAIMKFCFL